MTTIIRQGITGDGYDVTVLVGAQSYTLHFLSQPSEADLEETISRFAQNVMAEMEVQNKLEREEEDD